MGRRRGAPVERAQAALCHTHLATFTISVEGGCAGPAVRVVTVPLHGDAAAAASSRDDVEAEDTLWTADGDPGVWSRGPDSEGDRSWHAADPMDLADASLVSPPFTVADDEPLGLAFAYAYSFDTVGAGVDADFWDGGVIELTGDGGKTWEDVASYAASPYPGALGPSDNPLWGRPAFVGHNPSYPGFDAVHIDLGTALAGREIQLRFRIGGGSTLRAGAGWDIDDITLTGVLETPFPGWLDEDEPCEPGDAPTTSAGSGSGSGSGSESDTDPGAAGDAGDDGCGCRSAGSPAPLILLLAVLCPRRRARRRTA